MRATLLALALLLGAATAHADAIPGDDECPPLQRWQGGHDGECGCAVDPTRDSSPTALWLAPFALIALRAAPRRRPAPRS